MKHLTFLLAAISIVLFSACGNNQGKKKEAKDTKAVSTAEQYLTADLKIKMDSLVASMSQLGVIPMVADAQNGKIVLTAKEKMVKPNYLLPLSKATDAVTLTQKYRAIMMYRIDMAVAELYDMPTSEYEEVLGKLIVGVDNPAFTSDFRASLKDGNMSEQISKFYDAELEKGTVNFFWEGAVAGIVEQIFIMTKNIDKFIVCFDDESASEVTYRFILVHDAIESLIQYHPEMAALNEVLQPLYVINAINVQQLRDQLMELKGEIEVVRDFMLK